MRLTKRYLETCVKLGFRADTKFVTLRGNVIGFTCGKPDELRRLARAAIAKARGA
jgi:hypothetical protein